METAAIGDNARQQLKAIIERIERLEDDKRAIASDIKDVYAESKSNGYDTAALRAIVRMRREDQEKRKEREANIEAYSFALGLVD